jgi:hypothetical protein
MKIIYVEKYQKFTEAVDERIILRDGIVEHALCSVKIYPKKKCFNARIYYQIYALNGEKLTRLGLSGGRKNHRRLLPTPVIYVFGIFFMHICEYLQNHCC